MASVSCVACPEGSTSEPGSTSDTACEKCESGTYAKELGFPARIVPFEGRTFEGRVEVLHNGVWGSVDNDMWDMQDANVFCRELGMGDAVSISEGEYGESYSTQWSGFNCEGSESTIFDCEAETWGECQPSSSDEWGIMDCGSVSNPNGDDAGVVCSHASSLIGARECTVCEHGFYSDSEGSVACTKCPDNGITSGYAQEMHDNLSDCTRCPGGTFGGKDGLTCKVCPSGTYKYDASHA